MRRASIGLRLSATFAAVLTAAVLLTGAGARWAFQRSILATVDDDLAARARALREYLDSEARTLPETELAGELREAGAFLPAGVHFRVATTGWTFEAPGTEAWPAPTTTELAAAQGGARTVRTGGRTFRVLAAAMPRGWIQVGTPLEPYEAVLRSFTWTFLLATPLVLLAAGAGGYWMSRRALAPVDAITRAAREIGAADLSRRLPLRGSGDELDRLSETLNEMLARLQESFERITRFTADASHELRTPVAVIRASAELARMRRRTPEQYEQLFERIEIQSARLSELLEDLLLLARADAGAHRLELEEADAGAVVREACEEAAPLAAAKGLALDMAPLPEARLRCDPAALRRLLLILLDNAVKYTPRGGRIRVRAEAGRGQLRIHVQDTGIGISAEDLPRIFDRFYRASRDRSRGEGGAGLGLAIAQWIARQHHGEIRVASRPGEGSTFTLVLPQDSGLFQNRPPE